MADGPPKKLESRLSGIFSRISFKLSGNSSGSQLSVPAPENADTQVRENNDLEKRRLAFRMGSMGKSSGSIVVPKRAARTSADALDIAVVSKPLPEVPVPVSPAGAPLEEKILSARSRPTPPASPGHGKEATVALAAVPPLASTNADTAVHTQVGSAPTSARSNKAEDSVPDECLFSF